MNGSWIPVVDKHDITVEWWRWRTWRRATRCDRLESRRIHAQVARRAAPVHYKGIIHDRLPASCSPSRHYVFVAWLLSVLAHSVPSRRWRDRRENYSISYQWRSWVSDRSDWRPNGERLEQRVCDYVCKQCWTSHSTHNWSYEFRKLGVWERNTTEMG